MLAEKKYLEIINLIDDQGERYPEQHLYLKYWQLGMAGREANEGLAVAYLDELLEEGLWISQYLLRTSPSLENLQDSLEFETRVEDMAALQRVEQSQLLPLLTLRKEAQATPSSKDYPLFIGYHAGGGIALTSLKFWQPAAKKGWLVAAPQSSQAQWSGSYVWEDRDLALRETQERLGEILQTYRLDPERLILAGHGSGGELAAWFSVSSLIRSNGFIAVAPEGRTMIDPDFWFRAAQSSKAEGLRGVILAGAEQDAQMPQFKKVAEILTALKIPTHLDRLPVAGTKYDLAFDKAISDAIDFILS